MTDGGGVLTGDAADLTMEVQAPGNTGLRGGH